MGSGGVVSISLSVDSGRLQGFPRALSRGIWDGAERDRMERRIAQHVRNRLKGRRFTDSQEAEQAAIEVARQFLVQNHRKRPLIIADANGES